MAEIRPESILSLRQALRSALETEDQSDPESQARAVLEHVLLEVRPGDAAISDQDPSRCPNCFAPATSTRSPYCGEHCREMAGFVRQFRSGLKLGWIFDDQKQVALGQVLWHVLGGGRPLRREIAPRRAIETALKRDGGICQACGAPATTVDHYGSGCNRPINLRAVCAACCEDRPFGEEAILLLPGVDEMIREMGTRIQSERPLRCCDDADTWHWRAYVAQRK